MRVVFVLRYGVLMPYCTRHLLQVVTELGSLEGGSFTRDVLRWMKGTLEVERLSRRELCEGDLEGGILYWGL